MAAALAAHGGVLTGNLQSAIGAIPSGPGPAGGLAQSLLHAGFFVVALAVWARYLDRRPLADYGVSATPRWLRGALAGFAAVVVGYVAWFAVGALLGRTTVTLAPSYPQGSLVLGLAILVVALALHAAVQQVVFVRSSAGPSVFAVSGTLPGLLGTVNQYGFPKLVVAYLVLAAWLRWRRGALPIQGAIAQPRGR